MPHVPRPSPARLAAPADAVRRAAREHLGARDHADGTLRYRASEVAGDYEVVLDVRPAGDVSVVAARADGSLGIPFFGWAFRPLAGVALRRNQEHALATLRHALEGAPRAAPVRPVLGLPPVAFAPDQARLLATAAAALAVVTFGGALFGQFADPVSESFAASDAQLGVALAVTRLGALASLVVAAFADRRGRRRSILVGVVGSAVACAVSAVAPTLELFTAAQVLQRACMNATAIVAGIAVVEEAPEGARAYAASMLALAGGFGFSFAVVALPFADLGPEGWRIPYAAGAATVLLVPRIARHLGETARYRALVERDDVARGRFRELLGRRYGRRFLLLAIVGFLTNLFNAPSSQLMNKYLQDERGFSSSGVALFRGVTTALPGLVGLLVGGRVAELRGRKPVALAALLAATVMQVVFFLRGGGLIWVMSAGAVLAASAAGIALATLDAELFPTEVRGTSNGLLLVVSVLGSVTGLVLAGALSDPLGGLGRAIALCGVAGLLAACFVPALPETGSRALDEISPSERRTGHGPRAAGA
ncbi:MAG: hypothetical protein KatS3mg009_2142 [Acidimicrobiia bacterium]|nr:MAG: hypothetical protein KatS3mg009_2142 [Acidimicrobiia bacterium]